MRTDPSRPTATAVLVLLTILSATAPLPAHDLWLIPDEQAPAGRPLTVRAHSGMKFPKSEHAPDPAAFLKRIVVEPDGTRASPEALGREGTSGLLRFRPAIPGVYLVAVETRPKLITLPADAFNDYLVADGLPHIYRLRAREKTLDQPGRERYTKSPKALVRVGRAGGGDPCRIVGLPLEIVPLRDPFALKVSGTLRVRVLFRGEPLRDANLGWSLPDDGEAPRGTVRTDGHGEALVPIAQTGLMTVRLTHMTRPREKDYEWESFWTTLTFRIPD